MPGSHSKITVPIFGLFFWFCSSDNLKENRQCSEVQQLRRKGGGRLHLTTHVTIWRHHIQHMCWCISLCDDVICSKLNGSFEWLYETNNSSRSKFLQKAIYPFRRWRLCSMLHLSLQLIIGSLVTNMNLFGKYWIFEGQDTDKSPKGFSK